MRRNSRYNATVLVSAWLQSYRIRAVHSPSELESCISKNFSILISERHLQTYNECSRGLCNTGGEARVQPHLHGSMPMRVSNHGHRPSTCCSCSCGPHRETNTSIIASDSFFLLVCRSMQRREWCCIDPQRSHTARNQENGGKLETAHASSGAYSRESHMPSSSRQVLRASPTMHCRLEGDTLFLKNRRERSAQKAEM